MPWKAARLVIAERMGWTLEYVDALDIGEVMDLMAVWSAQNK